MLLGYARVSTIDQNLALQRDAFTEAGCGKIFTERLSGAVTDRPALREALEFARHGDTLMADPDISVIQIAQRLGVSPSTLYGTLLHGSTGWRRERGGVGRQPLS